MKKAILASTQSIWLEKILNGKKNREMRRTKPQCELPIDVYLGCTKGRPYLWAFDLIKMDSCPNWEWEKHFSLKRPVFSKDLDLSPLNGKVVGKFTLKTIETVEFDWTTLTKSGIRRFNFTDDQIAGLCMSVEEANKYALQNTKKDVQLWHIDDLVIFDEPKELSDFPPYFPKLERWCHEDSDCSDCPFFISEEECRWLKGLTKAPQSWQYVEVD